MFETGTLRTLSTMALRDRMSAAINEVVYRKQRFLITRRGEGVAALIAPGDLRQLEEFWRKTLRQKELEQLRVMEAWRRAQAAGDDAPPDGGGHLHAP